MIEILVTVAVTSIGLLGMAGLMAVSAKVNHRAYLQTQADFIAQALIESMRVNAAAVVDGEYEGNFAGDSTRSSACWTHGCSPSERAAYDRSRFAHALNVTLPNATAALKCVGDDKKAGEAAPYNGICRLEVGWSERPLTHGASDGAQTQVWIFQP